MSSPHPMLPPFTPYECFTDLKAKNQGPSKEPRSESGRHFSRPHRMHDVQGFPHLLETPIGHTKSIKKTIEGHCHHHGKGWHQNKHSGRISRYRFKGLGITKWKDMLQKLLSAISSTQKGLMLTQGHKLKEKSISLVPVLQLKIDDYEDKAQRSLTCTLRPLHPWHISAKQNLCFSSYGHCKPSKFIKITTIRGALPQSNSSANLTGETKNILLSIYMSINTTHDKCSFWM